MNGLRNGELWLLRIASLVGLGLSGFLLSVSLGQRGAPPGCGPGSGCEAVLASRWSQALGMSVSVPAMVVYLLITLALNQLHRQRPRENQSAAWAVLALLGAALVSAAIWFTALQAVVLKQFCPWCMLTHTLGSALGGWLLVRAWQGDRLPRRQGLMMSLIGVGAVVALAMLQSLTPATSPPPGRNALPTAPAAGQSDTGRGEQRSLVLLQGMLVLNVAQTPHHGSIDAPVALAVMLDYACPHCRRLHAALDDLQRQHPDQLVVLSLPTPLSTACNPHLLESEPRFDGSCDLAKLALAVWRTAPRQFADFERWLFEPQQPRDPREARAYAEGLVGVEPLTQSLADPRLKADFQRNIEVYGRARIERLPALLSPRTEPIMGSLEPEELQQWLDRQWAKP